MKAKKTVYFSMTINQALALRESLTNDITANQHILNDPDCNPETGEIAKTNINSFLKLQRRLSGVINTFKE